MNRRLVVMAREREREGDAGLTETERPNRTDEMVLVNFHNIIMRGDSSWVEPRPNGSDQVQYYCADGGNGGFEPVPALCGCN